MQYLTEIVGDESVVSGKTKWSELRNLPSWQITMNPVQESSDLKKVRKGLKEMIILLMRQVALNIQIPHKYETPEGQ